MLCRNELVVHAEIWQAYYEITKTVQVILSCHNSTVTQQAQQHKEDFRAYQSNSGYWNGAMNAPLAASTWIFMSHPFAVFTLPAHA